MHIGPESPITTAIEIINHLKTHDHQGNWNAANDSGQAGIYVSSAELSFFVIS